MLNISDDLNNIINIIKNNKCVCLLAPSFVIDFKYPKIIYNLREIGFAKVVELTYSAKIISSEYHEIIKKKKHKQRICANCPSVVKFIENKFPQHKSKLVNIASPMVVMGRFCKKEFGDKYKTIFIGPCFTKKIEANENKNDIDFALTFKELQEILFYMKSNNKLIKVPKTKKNLDFDKFYNDYTKIYPIGGAVAKTIHTKKILSKKQIICCETQTEIEKAIIKMENCKNIKFLDILFCKGGCCGGPGIISKEDIKTKIKKVANYREISKEHKIGKNKGLLKYADELKLDIRRDKNKKID
jgi:iron only hydrogenase large subunit-like protein